MLFFLLGGAFLLWQSERRPISFWFRGSKEPLAGHPIAVPHARAWDHSAGNLHCARVAQLTPAPADFPRPRRFLHLRFPTILDDYVLRDFLLYLVMIGGAFVTLLLVFTLFELLGDILRNGISALVVGEYLLNVTPYFLYYPIAPMSMLLAVLVTFGLLQRSNEITAIKATGISLYRIVIPVLFASVVGRRRAVCLRPVLSSLH